jgi:hypothetical protein
LIEDIDSSEYVVNADQDPNGNSFFANLYLVNQFLCNPVLALLWVMTCCNQSNIIVQSSNDPIAVNAANALFNKHPNTSILVKFDQNGNLITLKGEAYTPTGDTRLFRQFLAQACRYKWLWRSLG